jgi:hypothetical protein
MIGTSRLGDITAGISDPCRYSFLWSKCHCCVLPWWEGADELVVLFVEALHFGHVYCRTQTSMASASEDPYEAEDHAVEEHDLEEQPKKK